MAAMIIDHKRNELGFMSRDEVTELLLGQMIECNHGSDSHGGR